MIDIEQLKKNIQDTIQKKGQELWNTVGDPLYESAKKFIGSVGSEIKQTAEALPYFPEAFEETQQKIQQLPGLKQINQHFIKQRIGTYLEEYNKQKSSGIDDATARKMANKKINIEHTLNLTLGTTEPLKNVGKAAASKIAKKIESTVAKNVEKAAKKSTPEVEIAPKTPKKKPETKPEINPDEDELAKQFGLKIEESTNLKGTHGQFDSTENKILIPKHIPSDLNRKNIITHEIGHYVHHNLPQDTLDEFNFLIKSFRNDVGKSIGSGKIRWDEKSGKQGYFEAFAELYAKYLRGEPLPAGRQFNMFFDDITPKGIKEVKPEGKPVPKELEPLTEEARKYKSYIQFEADKKIYYPIEQTKIQDSKKELADHLAKLEKLEKGIEQPYYQFMDLKRKYRPYTKNNLKEAQKVANYLKEEIKNNELLLKYGFKNGKDFYNQAVKGTKEVKPKKIAAKEEFKVGDMATKKTTPETEKILNVSKPLIHTKYLKIAEKEKKIITQTAEQLRGKLEEIKGEPLSHKEVIEAAKISEVMRGATTREGTLAREATLLKTRQQLAALAQGKGVSKDFIESLRKVSQESTALGRQLEALKTVAEPSLETSKISIIKKLLDVGADVDEIVKKAEGVDFNNLKEVTKFYRQFVKPKLGEVIDEYRYINLLSSPRTHIVNAFSNLLQATLLKPATKLASGAIDFIGSSLSKNERKVYISEVPAYYKGFLNSIGEATQKFYQSISGNAVITRPDIRQIPTGVKILAPFQLIPRLLEASDIFFRTLIAGGERESLTYRALKKGIELDEAQLGKIARDAEENASYYTFRQIIDPSNKTGQGKLLSLIDKLTQTVYGLRRIPGVGWFIPFVQTPMNILKQGIEYSPLGITTLPGAANKTEQLAKSMVGSSVLLGASWLAMNGRTTWATPTSPKEKEAFYASGRQPYSIKIGDNWVSYSKLGPLAYPIAMASAFQWFLKENPKAMTDSNFEKNVKALSGIAKFFSDQSYVEGISDLVNAIRNTEGGVSSALTNIPSQFIPLSSLQRWVSQLIDPIYRKPESGFSIDAIIQNLEKGLPVLSKNLESYKTPLGTPSRRQYPALNAVSPFNVSKENKLGELQLQKTRQEEKMNYLKKDLKENIKKKIEKNFPSSLR